MLLAYEYRCCVCARDLRMAGHAIGLEAAHIKWFQARGPDVVTNGLALCSLHHKIFDLGAFTVLPGNQSGTAGHSPVTSDCGKIAVTGRLKPCPQ